MTRSLLLTFGLLMGLTLSSHAQLLPVLTQDTTICPGESVLLAEPPAAPTGFFYQWNPAEGLNNDTIAAPLATPGVTTKYFLTVTSADSSQTAIDSVTITVLPTNVTIVTNSNERCIGDTLNLGATISGPPGTLVWESSLGTVTGSDSLDFFPYVPTATETFIATYSDLGCTVSDTVTVFVDSLPASLIRKEPFKELYCPGDTVFLLSETYEPANYPAIQFQWSPARGFETADSLWNMVITAQDSSNILYTRQIDNRGCFAEDTIRVMVDTPLVVIPPLADICPGDSVQLEVILGLKPDGVLEWTPPINLSCTDCPNPIANPPFSVVYQVKQSEVECPDSVQVPIDVEQPPYQLIPDTICAGESVFLSSFSNPNATYRWLSEPNDPSLDTLVNPGEPIATPQVTTTYTVTAEIDNCVFTDQVTIEVLNDSVNLVVIPFPDTTVNSGGTATLFASSGLPAGTEETYQWQLSPGGNLFGPEQTIEDITQSIQVSLFYSNTCAADTVNLEILILQVLVPGAFTPNGDGDNDFFDIVRAGDPQVEEFRVWNRWGQLVYDNDTPDQGWDGRFNNTPAPSDVYVYRVIVRLPDGTMEEFKGDVTLIR